MKVCPTCNHQYAEGDGNFCVRDGTPLVAAAQPPAAPPHSPAAPLQAPPQAAVPQGAVPSVPGQMAGPQPQPGGQGGPIAGAANQFGNLQQGAGQQMPQPRAAAGAPLERLKCDWCQGTNEST